MSAWGKDLAEEEVKKYVNRNLAMFHRVQVNQMIHLPCFTDTDRQKIKASCTNDGNNETTFVFFQRLCCREGWVLPFVEALREQNMGELAAKLERLYRSKLLPPPTTPPAALTPPAVNRPSAPPLQPEANEQRPTENQALPWSPSPLAASSANPVPQNIGDYRTPVQENSHPSEKSKLVIHPKTTDKGTEPGLPPTSGKEESAPVPGPVEERPLLPQTTSILAAESVEQKWDGRQHRPVTVKNGCFGNAHRPEDSGTGSASPAGASGNQPEEDYYSSDSVLLALHDQREDSAAERKVHVLRGDRKREKTPASQGSPENQTLPFLDPSPRSAPADDAQRTGTKPRLPVADPMPEPPIRLPPSGLDGSSPKPHREVFAAGGDRPSGDLKLPGMETRPSAVGGHKRDSRIFDSNRSENDTPSKPGVLSSDHAADLGKLGSGNGGETTEMYSGSSERLRLSNDSSVSVSNSDPILISESSSISCSTTSPPRGRNRASGAVDATAPPEVDPGEEDDTSFRSHHVRVEKNPSVELLGVPMDGASSRPSARAPPDSTSDGQPSNRARIHSVGPSLPDEKVEVEVPAPSGDFWMLLGALALAFLASAAYVLYKKK